MNPVLALDLGMTTGYAHCIVGGRGSGIIKLNGTKKRPMTYGASLFLFLERVRGFIYACDGAPVTICYEDVRRHLGTRASHVYGALEGLLHTIEQEQYPQITLRTYSVQQIKQHATGRCVASKDEMLAAAQMRWTWCKTHDEADALWLLDLELTANKSTEQERTT